MPVEIWGIHLSVMAKSREICQLHVHEKKSPAHLFKCQPILLHCSQYDLNKQRPKRFCESSVMTITSSERAGKSINQRIMACYFTPNTSCILLPNMFMFELSVLKPSAMNLWPHDRFEAVLKQNPRHNLSQVRLEQNSYPRS